MKGVDLSTVTPQNLAYIDAMLVGNSFFCWLRVNYFPIHRPFAH